MGSKGIRPRKRKRPLRRLRGSSEQDVPPAVMWPEAGSGYEANQYSPAGQIQREWWLIRRCRDDWRARVLVGLLIVPFVLYQVVVLVTDFLRGVF